MAPPRRRKGSNVDRIYDALRRKILPNRGSQMAPFDLASLRDYLEAIDLCQRGA